MPGVYLSFPFCSQKCTFCNFASGVFPQELRARYLRALRSEIADTQWPWVVETLYIGGGTPSQIGPEDFIHLLSAIPGKPWKEATVEAAPGSFTAREVRAWKEAGINRVSLGVQSFVTAELSRVGRRHTAGAVLADCNLLREHGIYQINIDLIAGLPAQTEESWNVSLDYIGKLAPPHVSVYMFEVDDDSRLGREVLTEGSRYGAGLVPDSDLTATLYETAVHRLGSLGLERYEISNFAAPGMESLHNLKYWRLESYLGFGADAHSCDGGKRWGNVESAAEYVAHREAGKTTALEVTAANPQQERYFVGLRLMDGVVLKAGDRERLAEPISRFRQSGLLEVAGDRLRLTGRGVLLSNEVFGEFIG